MPVNRSSRAALAVVSGLALALAFPKFDFNLLAWIAFVPLLYAIEGETPGRVFLWGWLQGLACNVAALYWITITLHTFAGVRIELAILPMILLAAVVALFSGAALWLTVLVSERLGITIVATLPIAWTAIEWVRTYFPIG